MFIIDDRYKNYGLEYTMSYTLTQYQTTPGISRDYVSTFELGSFSANTGMVYASTVPPVVGISYLMWYRYTN